MNYKKYIKMNEEIIEILNNHIDEYDVGEVENILEVLKRIIKERDDARFKLFASNIHKPLMRAFDYQKLIKESFKITKL